MGHRATNVKSAVSDPHDSTYTVIASFGWDLFSHFCAWPHWKKKHIVDATTLPPSFSPLRQLWGAEVMGGRTHGVAAGWVHHGSWSAEQAEELGAPPLLCWQVPAWVDHPQRQQRRRHRLHEGTEKREEKKQWGRRKDAETEEEAKWKRHREMASLQKLERAYFMIHHTDRCICQC